MEYEGNIYRPPSEAYSLIVQATVGCSNNTCTFCSMYKDKTFRARQADDVLADLREARGLYRNIGRVFLADGDAMVLSANKLLIILEAIRGFFPECERVSIYATPQSILRKTTDELSSLAEAGLGIVYIGAESGDDDILLQIKKGTDADEIIRAITKAESAGLTTSVTFISGLGGLALSERHATGCARIITEATPSYAALLTLLLEPDAPMHKDMKAGLFTFMTPEEIAKETLLFLNLARPETDCIFRSNHASNYVPLKGTLPQDNDRLICVLEDALANKAFKSDYFRLL